MLAPMRPTPTKAILSAGAAGALGVVAVEDLGAEEDFLAMMKGGAGRG